MTNDDPRATWQPSTNFTPGRKGTSIDRIVLHTTEGGFAGSVAWLRGAAGGTSNRDSSAHYVISADGTRIIQLVREIDTAWHAGNLAWNRRSVGIEQEGYAGKGAFSNALYQAAGELVARIAARHRIPLDRTHVIGHAEVPAPNDHTDPGPGYDWQKLLAAADRANSASGSRFISETSQWLGGGFKSFWERLEAEGVALLTLGFPVSGERRMRFGAEPDAPERTIQLFERGALIWEPELAPPWDVHQVTTGQLTRILDRFKLEVKK